MTCFLDRYNRPLRIVWRGITRVRLQDNRGNTMILTNEQLKITIMKQFMITFRNLKNGLTLDTLFNAKSESEALSDAERLCEKLGKHNIKLEIASINEFDKC